MVKTPCFLSRNTLDCTANSSIFEIFLWISLVHLANNWSHILICSFVPELAIGSPNLQDTLFIWVEHSRRWLHVFFWCSSSRKWVWVNTYRYIFSGMNIHKSQLFWGSLGTRVLTHPQTTTSPVIFAEVGWPGRVAEWKWSLYPRRREKFLHRACGGAGNPPISYGLPKNGGYCKMEGF